MTKLFNPGLRTKLKGAVLGVLALLVPLPVLGAENSNFHRAPDSAKQMKNPFKGQQNAEAGKRPLVLT